MAETSTRTVDRALDLLAVVCERGRASLVDSAREVDLPPSTALRLLRTMEARGFLRREGTGEYLPGSRMIQLGARALSNETLVALCEDPMRDLVAVTGESAYLSIPGHGDTALYVAIVEGTHSVRHSSWVGRTIPREGSAAGAVLRGEVPGTGYVVAARGIEQDVTALAAPIRADQRIVASLSLLIPTYRLPDLDVERFGRALVERATIVSERLGHRPARSEESA